MRSLRKTALRYSDEKIFDLSRKSVRQNISHKFNSVHHGEISDKLIIQYKQGFQTGFYRERLMRYIIKIVELLFT